MAIPSTGSLYLTGCSSTCRSISSAVCNTTTPPQSLSGLSAFAGIAKPYCMRKFYNYDNFVVTPTTINGVISGGTTVYVTICAPTSNSYSSVENETWLTPGSESPTNPTGVQHSISVSQNTGDARSGVVCYVPTYGNTKCVTINQNAGIVRNPIYIGNISSSGAFDPLYCCFNGYLCGIQRDECVSIDLLWCLCGVSDDRETVLSYFNVNCNERYLDGCMLSNNRGFDESGTLSIKDFCFGDVIDLHVCTSRSIASRCLSSFAYISITSISEVIGYYCIGSPNIICVCVSGD